jgi:putative transposase
LYYDKPKKLFYLLVAFHVEVPDPSADSLPQVVGVDMGQRYLVTSTTLTDQTTFVSGKRIRHKANHFHRTRKKLQHKGTRSAKRRMLAFSGRERRFHAAVNHTIAKHLIQQHPHTLFGLEQLTHIRERTKRKRGKQATKKQRRANREQASWNFADLHTKVSYKATCAGSLALKVDADYTSQMCVRCGHTCRENRPREGLLFVCQACGYRLHADLLGARNIALRTLLVRQDWARTGMLSMCPDVSGLVGLRIAPFHFIVKK